MVMEVVWKATQPDWAAAGRSEGVGETRAAMQAAIRRTPSSLDMGSPASEGSS